MAHHHVQSHGKPQAKFVIKPAERPSGNVERYAEKYAETYPESYGDAHVASPEELLSARGEPPHDASLTAYATEALRTGIYPQRELEEIPGQDELLRAGDPDSDPLENLYNGEELPGGSTTSPDQSDVDAMSRLAGMGGADRGELRAAEEIAEHRDLHRWQQESLSPKK